jgi:hypothetical protein
VPLGEQELVWYVAYGSNLLAERFSHYLAGGRPEGARRAYAGCRDTTPWRRHSPVEVPGRLRFGGVSPTWGGGLAFLDPDAPGSTRGRGYLVTAGQFCDVARQEARVEPGHGLALSPHGGRWDAVVPAAYETVLGLGELDGHPTFTFTTATGPPAAAPAPAYLRTILAGLIETYGGTAGDHAAYLMGAPGVALSWTECALAELGSPARG